MQSLDAADLQTGGVLEKAIAEFFSPTAEFLGRVDPRHRIEYFLLQLQVHLVRSNNEQGNGNQYMQDPARLSQQPRSF